MSVISVTLGAWATVAAARAIVRGHLWPAFDVGPLLVVTYWFAKGAWLRTTWGRPAADAPGPPSPPTMSPETAQALIVVGALCVVAAAVALVGQLVSRT